MNASEPVFFASASELSDWLKHNHNTAPELWVAFRKKSSGLPGISYQQALDEALCFGWIDGLQRSVDATSYAQRFTPRKPKSAWSAANIRRAHELVAEGRMRAPGLAAFEGRDEGRARQHSQEREKPAFDAVCEETFRARREAWDFFQAQPAGYRRLNTWWVMSAKRDDTRRKRLDVLIEACVQGRRLDPMQSPYKQVATVSPSKED